MEAVLLGGVLASGVGPNTLQQLLPGRRIHQPRQLDSGDAHERDFGETQHAATPLEVPTERCIAIRKHEVTVHVIVRDHAAHGQDLDASRPRALIKLSRRERHPDRTAHRDVGQASEAGQDNPIADSTLSADLLNRFKQEIAVSKPHDNNFPCARPARHHSLSRHRRVLRLSSAIKFNNKKQRQVHIPVRGSEMWT